MKLQQQLFCEGLLIEAKSDTPTRQKQPIIINFGKHKLEVSNNCIGFLTHRENNGLWSSWSTNEEITETFDKLL